MNIFSRPSIGAVRDYEGIVLNNKHAGGGQPVPVSRNYADYEMLQRQLRPPPHRDYDAVSFSSRAKDYEALRFRGPVAPPQVAPKPRLSSVDEAGVSEHHQPQPRRPSPPLPPKPVRGPPPLPPHAQHLHNNFGKGGGQPLPGPGQPPPPPPEGLPMGVTRTKNGVYLAMPGEKGYNVSFV